MEPIQDDLEPYEPFDQTSWLGRAPWDDTPALKAWEQAHGHDVRLKCYVEFGCQVIEPTLERRIDRLVAERDELRTQVGALKIANAGWDVTAAGLVAERDRLRRGIGAVLLDMSRDIAGVDARRSLETWANRLRDIR